MSSNKIVPDICEQDGIYMPELEPCDECDRLEAEFEQALIDAQTAAADAQSSAESATNSASTATTEAEKAETARRGIDEIAADMVRILNEAYAILYQITGASINKFSQVFTTTANQSTFVFSPSGYEYHEGDYFSVYINGLKCVPSEFTSNANEITLVTPITLADQTVEIIAEVVNPGDESE